MIFNKHKQWLSAALAIVMMAGFITPAFAADTSVPVTVDTQPANFSVTLPTVLPVDVNAEGTVTVALDATITNNSAGPITLASAKVTPKNTWSLVSMDTDFVKLPAGTKSIGFSLFNKEVPTSGTADISAVSLINGNSSIELPYGSKLTTQNEALTEQPLDVLFTVGWYKGGNSVIDSPEALLALDKENLSMMVGAEETITATFVEKETPKGRSAFMLQNVDGVTFTSTNEEVATVDSNGLITAVGKGTAKVIATARGLDATCNITVNALKVPLTAIDVNKTNVILNKGTTEKLVLMYNPDKFDASATVTWSSSDSNVVTVSPLNEVHDGTTGTPSYATITGVNGGNATITVNVASGGNTFSKTINVTINEPMTGLDVPASLEVKAGETTNITTTKLPSSTTDTNIITYESSDTNIATVDSTGLITGVNEGNITISIKSGYFTKNTSITVTSAAPPVLSNITDYYTYTYDAVKEGYKVALSTNFKTALNGNTKFTDREGNVWTSGSPLPNPGSKYNGKPVINMSSMFNASQAIALNLSLFDTSNVTDMSSMFYGSTASNLDLTSFDTSKVITMQAMFYSSKATVINLTNFNTSNVTNMGAMFDGSKATRLNLSSFNTSKVTTMYNMFNGSKATTIDGLNKFNTSNVTSMSQMFSSSEAQILDLSSFDTSKVTGMGQMFSQSKATNIIGLNKLNTSKVTSMYRMFSFSKVIPLDLSSFDTSNVTNMSYMFEGLESTILDLSKFNTSNVTDMSWMFNSSQATTIKGLDNFNTSNVTNMSNMFSYSQIATLDLSSFNTSNVTNMSSMFSYSRAITLDLSNFDTSSVTNMMSMFSGSKATILDLSSFDTTKVTNVSYMFQASNATTGYARTQTDANKLNGSSSKPATLIFTVK